MSGIAKKTIAVLIIFALAFTPTVTAFAASSNGHTPPGQQHQNQGKGSGADQNSDSQTTASPSASPQETAPGWDKQSKHTDDLQNNSGKDNSDADLQGKSGDHKGGQNAHAQLDTTAINAAISSISSTNTQKALLALLATYQTSLNALNSAIAGNADEDTIKTDRDAVVAAQSAMLKALYAAGIKLSMVLGNGAENKAGQNAGGQLDMDAINAAIAALSDANTKASLQTLAAAYKTAQSTLAKDIYGNASADTLKADRQAMETAKKALTDALLAAGVQATPPQASPSGEPADQTNVLDLAAINAAIAALSNVDTQASLLALVTAYQTALDTMQSDVNKSASDDTQSADRKAVQSAKEALQSALSAAGIALPAPSASASSSPSPSPTPSSSTTATTEPAQVQTQSTGGFWPSIVNWFMGIFGRQTK